MANLAPTQVEQLQSIGAYLRQVRQEQGLSLDVLANQIFIRPALLQALETGRDEQLPEPVFIQGFIRRYAEALGLDGKAISQEFVVTPASVLPTPELVTPAINNGAALPSPTPPAPGPSLAGDEKTSLEPMTSLSPSTSDRRFGWPIWVALGIAALLIGGALWGLFGRNPSPETVTETSNPTTQAETPVDDPLTSPDPTETEPEATEDPEDEDPSATLEAPIVVKASLSDRAWMSVVADGRTLYEGTPESGYEETWTAQNSLVFRTGNAGGVSLSVNGDDPVVLGETGVVRTLTLTPSSGADAVESP